MHRLRARKQNKKTNSRELKERKALIKEATGYGLTVEEAKENAIVLLGADEGADIQFDVVATPKKKTLGLFGGRRAEVRAFIELPDEKPKKKTAKKEDKANKKTAKSAEKTEKKAVKEEKKEQKKADTKPSIYEGYSELVSEDKLEENSAPARAVKYIRTILASLNCGEVKITVGEKENAALVCLEGDDLGIIIGRRGETLDAIQYLASLAANNGGGYYKVTLNIGDYREKREEALVSLAKRVCAQVLKTGRSRSLEPMNPYERRIIHTAVQEIEGVVSNSFGEGENRRVVIAVEGGDMRPPRMDNRRRGDRSRGRDRKPSATVKAPEREPKRDSDIPLYGKVN